MSVEAIAEQLAEYCGCTDVIDTDVTDLINIISIASGWMKEPCETFLEGERREVLDLGTCEGCPIEFKPYYHPYDVDSFTFKLVRTQGLDETVTDITDFTYSTVDSLFRIDPGLPDCDCASEVCGCPVTYRLLIEYTAGYETLPECLLPVFCNLLEVINAKNSCECEDCGCETNYGEADQQPYVKYKTGDVVSVFLENDLGKILVEQYKNQLAMISIYRRPPKIWAVFA